MSRMCASTPVSHEQRIEITRHQILDATVALLTRRGVKGSTVSAIIEASGVSRATFYRHFQDLADALNAALQRDFDLLLSDFVVQRHEQSRLETQIVEDFVWFVRQLSGRPGLALLFGADSTEVYRLVGESLGSFREAGLICSQPTFERAKAEGRLREDVTLGEYVDWATFVVTSLQLQPVEFAEDEMRLRTMLHKFLVPSLIC